MSAELDRLHAEANLERALAQSETYHRKAFEDHGATAAGVGWKDRASQLLRFRQLAQIMQPPPAEPVSVNDFGCGYGALLEYLDGLSGVSVREYFGYDISAIALVAARKHADARATFIQADEVTEDADYSFCSGTLNFKGEASDETWRSYVERAIEQLASRSRVGFAFNLMSTHVDFTKPDLFYADPAYFFTFCKSRISRYVTLLHDYPLYEWTILVRMELPTQETAR